MKRITLRDKEAILDIIHKWPVEAKFTWDMIIDVTEKRIGKKYSRQGLASHEDILIAYQTRKNIVRKTQRLPISKSMSLQDALKKIETLESENATLKAENQALLEQFARWSANADGAGISFDRLNQPLENKNPSTDKWR